MNEAGKIVAYAMDFASFIVQGLDAKTAANLKSIVLFGSAARGEAAKDSDVDIFVDVVSKTGLTSLQTSMQRLVKRFYTTEAFRRWKLMAVDNDIKPVVGRLDEWKDLKVSVIADGLVLYGKYQGAAGGKASVVVYWGKVKPEAKRVLLSKKLYGYTYNGKRYEGVTKLAGAEKLGSNSMMVPLEGYQAVAGVFKKLGVTARTAYVSRAV